jgi:hypothetical protein
MRWSRPSYGEERVKKRFALFPIKIGTLFVWLEMYTLTEYWNGREWKILYAEVV